MLRNFGVLVFWALMHCASLLLGSNWLRCGKQAGRGGSNSAHFRLCAGALQTKERGYLSSQTGGTYRPIALTAKGNGGGGSATEAV